MRKILTLYLMLLGTMLSAQSLDPTVRVTGTYKGNVSSEDFPHQEVVLPDSVATFDTRFDYSVFEKPYLGSYDFSPYLMDLRPKAQEVRKNQLYLRAGAGYTLHPLVDAYWNPAVGDSCFNLSAYATHRSYWGTYQATNAFDGNEVLKSENGLESDTRAGVKGRYDFKQVVLDWDAFYKGLHAKTGTNLVFPFGQRGYNLANVSVGAHSPRQQVGRIFYDARLDAHYAQDNFTGWEDPVLRMGYVALYGKVGDMVSPHHGFQFDVDLRAFILRSGADAANPIRNNYAQLFSVTPHYLMTFKKFRMDLGANVAYVLNDNFSTNYRRFGQIVYPDVTIAYDPWKQWATFFLRCKGGVKMNTYDDMLESNPYFHALYNYGGEALLDNSVERINASLGVDGKITPKWSYHVELGYKVVGSAPMEAVKIETVEMQPQILPGIAYVNYQSFYAGLRSRYHCEFLDVSGAVRYQGTYNIDHNHFIKGALTLPPFLLELRAMYNYNKRIYAGLSLEAQGPRKAYWWFDGVEKNYTIRAFWNLGLDAQYVLSPEWSFWLHCDNLLFQEIQRHPFFAQKGGQFTLGITLNIR
ncbi:MAG: hypothetical protein J6X69_06230 [Bacteroidales bacterium]|nr:hypothetical protein [Bacteroidales bacterium]